MARRSRRSKPSGLSHLVVGLALGLAVAAGVYFSDLRSGAGLPEVVERVTRPEASAARSPAQAAPAGRTTVPSASGATSTSGTASAAASRGTASTGAAGTTAASARPAAAAGTAPAASAEPSFDFYEILPQYEVLVPDEVETVSRPATPAAPVAAPGSYVLQTGSFRSHADADRMQASLALLGVESRIQKVTIDAGEFHRVRIGPVSDLDELNRIRTVLRQAGIESLMMKVD